MVENDSLESDTPSGFTVPVSEIFMNRPLITQLAAASASHAHGKKIAIGAQMFILIIALYDTCHIILAALFAPQEIHKLPEVRIQPLIGIYRETPFSRTAVQHNVAGGGKIIDPWEIKQDVRILLCHGPASVGRPGVGHDQLTGDGSPQRGQGLQAPCEAADVIFKNDSD
ncbi:hypothetical protein ABHB30_09905 [Flavonifractor plautii]|nr:hypothetical protein [Flavonifractor plautii]